MILPVSSAQAARCAARHAIWTPRRTFTCCSFPSWSWTAAVTTAGGKHQTFAIRDHQQPIRLWRHQVPNRAAPPRRRGPRPPPRSTGKESTTAAPIASAAVTDERRSPTNLRGRPDPTGSISTSLSMNVAEHPGEFGPDPGQPLGAVIPEGGRVSGRLVPSDQAGDRIAGGGVDGRELPDRPR